MSIVTASDDFSRDGQGNSLYAALARTFTRSMALYFSRPVRLFRPSKVSGWLSLKGQAAQEGRELSTQYIVRLVRKHGFMVLPKHFVPPIMVNAFLGTVLWTTYAEASLVLESQLSTHPLIVTALSGGIAGGAQALVAAPAENVRLVLEGGTAGAGWSRAWKEVFRGTHSPTASNKKQELHQARVVRHWMKEVRDMAGRGWDGWGWGVVKDTLGFSVFFSIFELTRRIAATTRATSSRVAQYASFGDDGGYAFRVHFPRVVHAVTLVSGGIVAGLSYELICRPLDAARKVVYLRRILPSKASGKTSATAALLTKARQEGILSFFRDPAPYTREDISTGTLQRRLQSGLRILARAGPWGMGFLVWEAFGPGIS